MASEYTQHNKKERITITGPILYFPWIRSKYIWKYYLNEQLLGEGKENSFEKAEEKAMEYWGET